MKGTVLVVDDHSRPRRALATELEDAGFEVVQAEDGEDAWERFQARPPDVVITDMIMPRCDGIDLLSRIRMRSDVPVILFTARGTVASAALAFKAGADDFVSSSDVDIDDLVGLVQSAASGKRSSPAAAALEKRLVGATEPLRRLRKRLLGLAPLAAPVLICGEPGTGRDSVAQLLHEFGSSGEGDLLRLRADAGQLDPRAAVSAIYLDEVDTFSPAAQSYWAREIAPDAAVPRNGVRIMASISCSFASFARDRNVDSDLRRALSRFALELPTLDSVAADIPQIADAMLAQISKDVGRTIRLTVSAQEFLAARQWRGNASQLRRVLELGAGYSAGRQLRVQDIEEVYRELEESLDTIRQQHVNAERNALMKALQATGGNVTQSAQILGKSRSAVYRLLEKHGILRGQSR